MTNAFRVEGAIGAMAGGMALVAGHALNFLSGQPAGTPTGKGLVLAGHVALVFAFVGVFGQQRAAGQTLLGRVGMLLATLGTVLVSGIVFVELAATTGVDATPVFQAVGTAPVVGVGPLVFILGMLLVGASIVRGTTLSAGAGVVLIAGTLIFVAASLLPERVTVLTLGGAVVTGVGLVWIGVDLFASQSGQRARTRL